MRYLRFIFGLTGLCFILASPAMGDVYAWTINVKCDYGHYIKFSNVKNTDSGDIYYRFPNGSSVKLKHKAKSYNAVTGVWARGQFEGTLHYASGFPARVWIQYDESGTNLSGWGRIGNAEDCELSGTRTAMNASTKRSSTLTSSNSTSSASKQAQQPSYKFNQSIPNNIPMQYRGSTSAGIRSQGSIPMSEEKERKADAAYAESNHSITCSMALDIKTGTWDFSNRAAKYVQKARAYGLYPKLCEKILKKQSLKSKTKKSTSWIPTAMRADGRSMMRETIDRVVCKWALKNSDSNWTSNTQWDRSSALKSKYVEEAISRGFSEQDCAGILGRTTVVSSRLRPMTTITAGNRKVCYMALDQKMGTWDHADNARPYVRTAKDRGLSVEDCASVLDLKTGVEVAANSQPSKVLKRCTNSSYRDNCSDTYIYPDGRKYTGGWRDNKKHGQGTMTNPRRSVYAPATNMEGIWENGYFRYANKTPMTDPKPSQALVERSQEALKSLGLYRGSIDGIAGVQSKSALKQWQKSTGLNATGDIKEDQIAQLESDALEELARREQERKAKAKRLAEANRIKNPDAIAVIIGNRDYKGDTPDVEFAVNDADAMRDFVLNKLGYRSGNIIDLRDATQAELRATFGSKESHKGRLFDYVRADTSDVIVFYSGHGVPGMSDKRGYLLSVDADPNRAELTGYPVDTLLKNLSKIPAKSMTVFIDACFSGDSPKGMLVKSMSGLMVEIRQPKKTSSKMVVLTASRGDEAASWDEEAKHGLFTKHLLEALNGAADKQSKTGNKDGKVTLGEVKAYLDREMTYQARRRFSRDQHATVSGDLKTVLSAY